MLINVPEEIGKRILKKEEDAYKVYSWQAVCDSEIVCYLDFLSEEGDITDYEIKRVKERLIGSAWEDVDTSDIYEQITDLVRDELKNIRGE